MIAKASKVNYRLLSPLGLYPASSLSCSLGQLLVDDELLAIVTPAEQPLAESKLVASLLLATDFEKSVFKFYPLPYSHSTESSENFNVKQLKNCIKEKQQQSFCQPGETIPEFDFYQNAKGASLPLILGGTQYATFEGLLCERTLTKLADVLLASESSQLLKACKLICQSGQLSCHFQFSQQANLYLLFAIELYQELLAGRLISHSQLRELATSLEARADLFELAATISPIEYSRLYQALVVGIKSLVLSDT